MACAPDDLGRLGGVEAVEVDVEGHHPFWRGFRPSRIARIWFRADLYAAIFAASKTTISAIVIVVSFLVHP